MKTKTMLATATVMAMTVVSVPSSFAAPDSLADLFLKKAADEMAVDTTGVADVEEVIEEEVVVDPLAGTLSAEEREWKEGEKTACSDGIDNDGDGLIDFGEDLGCVAADDDSEEDEVKVEETAEPVVAKTEETTPEDEPAAVAVDPLAALFDKNEYEEVDSAPVVEETTPEVIEPVTKSTIEEVKPETLVEKKTPALPKSGPAVLGVLALAGAGAAIRKKMKK